MTTTCLLCSGRRRLDSITCYEKKAIHRGFERVQFESDLKLLVYAIHSRKRDNSEFSLILNDIILLMLSFYVNYKVRFVSRQINLVAHTLINAVNI
jgi:hypothetical protein